MAKTAYKILKNGKSFNGGSLTWSLPKDGNPGDWHEVQGKLIRCQNGLHVTTMPERHAPDVTKVKAIRCYQAEYDGDAIEESLLGEIVARRVRLIREVPWTEIDPDLELSPAIELLSLVWNSEGKTSGHRHSWRRLNAAMQSALKLAIESGMQFHEDDFAKIRERYNPGYWMHIEGSYATAIDGQHGPNASAIRAIEKHLGRTAFIVQESSRDAKKIRLFEGASFQWHEDMKREVRVKVTSFSSITGKDGKQRPCVIACSYKPNDQSGYTRTEVDKIFKITHGDIAAYHKAIRENKKKAS